VAPGAYWEGASKGFLSELLPGRLVGVEEIWDFESLRKVGETAVDSDTPLMSAVLANTKGDILLMSGSRPLVVRHRVGFGEVIFLAFDPTKSPFAKWRGAEAFWNWLFTLSLPESGGAEVTAAVGSGRGWYGHYQTAAGIIGNSLNEFPKVRPIPFLFVVLFLLVYVVMIGPVDYFVLKRLKHLEWTWFTFPAIAIAATLVAFWAISSSRTIKTYINQVSVEDWSSDGKARRDFSFATLLSPKNRRYTVSFDTPGAEIALLETARTFGRGPGLTSRPFEVRDKPDTGMTAEDLLIPVWSSRTFASCSVSTKPGRPPLEASLRIDGGRLVGTITNRTESPIKGLSVLHSTGVYSVGRVEALATVEVNKSRSRPLGQFVREMNSANRYGREGKRERVKDVMLGLTARPERRNAPAESYRALLREGAPNEQDLIDFDVSPTLSLRSVLDAGHMVVTAVGAEVDARLDAGDVLPERWETTVYRVCVKEELAASRS
jgi:hypothetical protein